MLLQFYSIKCIILYDKARKVNSMKNKKVIVTAVSLAIVSVLAITAAAAYDSSEDPLISLSYLRDIFKKELLSEVDEKLENFKADFEYDGNTDNNDNSGEDETNAPAEVPSQTYEVVELSEGDALYAISACEIILRSGKAVCVAPDATQGIADLTDATEIYNGYDLTKNHLCLIPRGDGRGLTASSETVYIMVRGDYTIVEK